MMVATLFLGLTFIGGAARPPMIATRPEAIVVAPPTTITAAIAAARPGDTIRIEPGVYREPMIVVDKPLTIIGEGWPVLDGQNAHQIVTVSADDVTIRGLVLRNVGTSYVEDRAAIKVSKARRCDIEHNRIEGAFFGIYLGGVTGCRIADNEISGAGRTEGGMGNGIHLWTATHVTIERNHISRQRDGIYFEFVHASEVRDNTSEHNLRYGLHFMYSDDCTYERNTFRANGAGVAVMYTKRVTMKGNQFLSNWGAASYGLLLKEVYDMQLSGNRFQKNTVGLVADGANRIDAEHNEFDGNGWAVKLMGSTEGGRFVANDFVANSFDVATSGSGSTAEFSRNYWDSYRGYDLNHDGVGDVPFHPVRLFSLLVQANQPALILLRSPFVALIDAVERTLPTLTPKALVDRSPAMRRVAS